MPEELANVLEGPRGASVQDTSRAVNLAEEDSVRSYAAAPLTIFVSAAVGEQTHPKFSGIWTIEPANSDPAPASRLNGGGGHDANVVSANQIVILQTPADVTITRGAQSLTYLFDAPRRLRFSREKRAAP